MFSNHYSKCQDLSDDDSSDDSRSCDSSCNYRFSKFHSYVKRRDSPDSTMKSMSDPFYFRTCNKMRENPEETQPEVNRSPAYTLKISNAANRRMLTSARDVPCANERFHAKLDYIGTHLTIHTDPAHSTCSIGRDSITTLTCSSFDDSCDFSLDSSSTISDDESTYEIWEIPPLNDKSKSLKTSSFACDFFSDRSQRFPFANCVEVDFPIQITVDKKYECEKSCQSAPSPIHPLSKLPYENKWKYSEIKSFPSESSRKCHYRQ